MTMIAPHLPESVDTNARVYLHALQAGQRPAERPAFGHWEPVVRLVESAFEKANGNKSEICQRLLESMVRSKKYPGLAALLAEDIAVESEQACDLCPALPERARLPPALAQGACPELDWYEAYSREASPEAWDEFHVFCGLWMLSTINARRSCLRLGAKVVYGNLMLALCADSSMFAKSTTAGIAKSLIKAAGLGYLLGPNRLTPAKLLSDLSGQFVPAIYSELDPARQEHIRERLSMPGQKGLYFDEFGKFLQAMLRKNSITADFADLLLEFDGCPVSYENATISRGGEPIEQPYLSLLGSMTPTNLKENAKAGADFWTEGFFARFSFVVAPPATAETIKDAPLDVYDLDVPPALLESLLAWHKRLGIPECVLEEIRDEKDRPTGKYRIHREPVPEHQCSMTDEAKEAWHRYRSALKRLCLSFGQKDFHASYARLPETALRMAILMASLSNKNVIDLRIWAKAQELAEMLRRNLHELYAQINANEDRPTFSKSVEEKVLAYVSQHQEDTDTDKIPTLRNLSRYIKNVDVKTLRHVVLDLEQIQMLKKVTRGKATCYLLGTGDDE